VSGKRFSGRRRLSNDERMVFCGVWGVCFCFCLVNSWASSFCVVVENLYVWLLVWLVVWVSVCRFYQLPIYQRAAPIWADTYIIKC
jgi:hypothetical protein